MRRLRGRDLLWDSAAIGADPGGFMGPFAGVLRALNVHSSQGLIADTIQGNILLIGTSVLGLIGSAALLGTARSLRAESRDPLNERHYIDF